MSGDNVTTQVSVAATVPDQTIIATDNIGGVNYQRVKLAFGSDGNATDASTTSPFPVYGSVAASSQWTVTVTPSTQFSVTTTPSSQITASVAPTTQWTVTTTPSSQITVANSSSTGVIGAVMPSTQWTVTTTPSSQITASVSPTTQWTVTTTPSSVVTVNLSSGVLALGTVGVTSITSSTSIIGNVTQVSTWNVFTNTNFKTTTSLTNATVSCSSTGVGGANLLVAGVASNTVRAFRGSLIASAAVTLGIYDSSSTGATTLANIPLGTNGAFNFDVSDAGDPLFVTASSGALALNLSAPAQIRGFIQYTQS